MNLVGRYDDSSIDIEGPTEGLQELAREMRDMHRAKEFSLSVPDQSPAPYAGYITSLQIESSSGNVLLTRSAARLTIRGAPEKLAILADNIDFLAVQPNQPKSVRLREHVHIEYYPGHNYLHEMSIPLLIAKS
jgi:hypothetical protein